MEDDSFAHRVRQHLSSRTELLATEWLTHLRARLPENPRRIFPDHTLLNHIPIVLGRLAATLVGEPLWEGDVVRRDFVALAELRRGQGYTSREIVVELQILRSLLIDDIEAFVSRGSEQSVSPIEVIKVLRTLDRGLDDFEAVAVGAFKEGDGSDRHERAHLLDTFGRAVTHELRNRLNGVALLLELVRLDLAEQMRGGPDFAGGAAAVIANRPSSSQSSGGDGIERRFSSLRAKLRDVERVVEDVFAIAVAHGRADPCERAFESLALVIDGTLADVREYAEQRGVSFRIIGSVPTFTVDSARVRIVLINLFSNAIKYSDTKKAEQWVEIQADPTPAGCRVQVADNGIGIPEDELQHIFVRYQRGSLSPGIDGQGIGLALAQAAIAQLGSRLDVRSRVGEGSTFFFMLNAPSSSLDEPSPSLSEPGSGRATEGS